MIQNKEEDSVMFLTW